MKLIYMEITHNTDDSARDLSSLDEGEELRGRKKSGIVIFFFSFSRSLPSDSFCKFASLVGFRSCMSRLWIQPSVCVCVCVCVCDGERVCELLSLCWPCRAPACLPGCHWSIMLSDWPTKSHYSETQRHISGELQVSLLCVVLIPHNLWTQMSCLQFPASLN